MPVATHQFTDGPHPVLLMGHSFWPSNSESPKDQRNLTNWVTDNEGLLGESVSNLQANSSGEERMTFSLSQERKQFGHMDSNVIFKIFLFFLGEVSLYFLRKKHLRNSS